MIKLIDILKEIKFKPTIKEGTISLTPYETKKLEDYIPLIIYAIKNKAINKIIPNIMTYNTADNRKAKVRFYVYNTQTNELAHYQPSDPENPDDNLIGVNYYYWGPAFENSLDKIYQTFTGDTPYESLLSSLKHELIHAKDPAVNNKPLNVKYDSNVPELYYGGWIEFPAQTGELLEAIKANSYSYITKNMTVKGVEQLNHFYQTILNYYSGKAKYFNQETLDWLSGGEKGNLVQNWIRKIAKWGGEALGIATVPGWSSMDLSTQFHNKIQYVKYYNPEGYKEFQKDLYKTIQSTIESINAKLPKDLPKLQAGGTGKLIEKIS
jgi:hypothetical protein